MRYENKVIKSIKYNCKLIFKYKKSKIKIYKNISAVKNDKTGELTNTLVETAGVLTRFSQSVHSLEEFSPLQESSYDEGTKKLWMK